MSLWLEIRLTRSKSVADGNTPFQDPNRDNSSGHDVYASASEHHSEKYSQDMDIATVNVLQIAYAVTTRDLDGMSSEAVVCAPHSSNGSIRLDPIGELRSRTRVKALVGHRSFGAWQQPR